MVHNTLILEAVTFIGPSCCLNPAFLESKTEYAKTICNVLFYVASVLLNITIVSIPSKFWYYGLAGPARNATW